MKDITIRRAIVSVSDKNNLNLLIPFFENNNIEVFSTGGTFQFLKKLNSKILLKEISSLSNFPEILGGRVKSLHPAIHSGILAKKNSRRDQNELKKSNFDFFDLVIVNLYPFEDVSNNPRKGFDECIENIDIGGTTMIRAAAKNFKNVAILTKPSQYEDFLTVCKNNNLKITLSLRKELALEAFKLTGYYEGIISRWFSEQLENDSMNITNIPIKKIKNLRYGENPHQKSSMFSWGKNVFKKISGKELSYNNINDMEASYQLVNEFTKNSCVILKHGNPCGVSINKSQKKSYINALNSDKISAFGGIVAFNSEVNSETAKEILKIFTELVIAPSFSSKAISLLKKKNNLILISCNLNKQNTPSLSIKTTSNHLLIQEIDKKQVKKKELMCVSKTKPNKKEIENLLFAFMIAKYVTSNAIVIVKNKTTLGIGVGQTNRLDSTKQAIQRMKKINNKNQKVFLASDGFFPFPDIIKLCKKNNISSIIQPGGSRNDKNIINEADKNEIKVVFTGIRHFKH